VLHQKDMSLPDWRNLSAYELSLAEPISAGEQAVRLRSGDRCPACTKGRLDYNGLLELACPDCGFIVSGAGGGCT
jgi:uncharacterized protein (DUF983 family)